jgi:hypothetical protein
MSISLQTKLIIQPHFLFLLTALVLLIASYFMRGQSVDLHIHDTYFVISLNYFIWTISIIFVLLWGLYTWTEQILWTKKLTWFHVLATLMVFVALATTGIWHDMFIPPVKSDTTSFQNFLQNQKRDQIIAYLISATCITGQLAYLVNLIVGLFTRGI